MRLPELSTVAIMVFHTMNVIVVAGMLYFLFIG